MTQPDAATTGSGFDALLGIEITHLDGAEVRARWTVSPELHQPYGIVHGGAHCAVVATLAARGARCRLHSPPESANNGVSTLPRRVTILTGPVRVWCPGA